MRHLLFLLFLLPFALEAQIAFPALKGTDTIYVGLENIHYIQDAPGRKVTLFDKDGTAPIVSRQYFSEIDEALGDHLLTFTVAGGDTIGFNKTHIKTVQRNSSGKAVIFSKIPTKKTFTTLEDYDDIFALALLKPYLSSDMMTDTSAIEDTLDAHNDRLVSLEEDVIAIEDTLNDHNDRLEAVEGDVAEQEDTLNAHNDRIIALQDENVEQEDTLDAHNDRLLALEGSSITGDFLALNSDTLQKVSSPLVIGDTVVYGSGSQSWSNSQWQDAGNLDSRYSGFYALNLTGHGSLTDDWPNDESGYSYRDGEYRKGILNINSTLSSPIVAGDHEIQYIHDPGAKGSGTIWVVTDIPWDVGLGDFTFGAGRTFTLTAWGIDTTNTTTFNAPIIFNAPVTINSRTDTIPVTLLGFDARGNFAEYESDNFAQASDLSSYKTELDELQTETTSLDTAEIYKILLVNSTGGAINIDPPLSPTAGQWFAVSDSRGTADSNNITIRFTTQSQLLHSVSENFILNTENAFARFTYINSTVGWIISN